MADLPSVPAPTDCTENCRRVVVCRTCQRNKSPQGRSVAVEAASGYCTVDCDGYFNDPKAGHLWPGEEFQPRTWTEPAPPLSREGSR